MSSIEKMCDPRESKMIVPNVVSRVFNYADRFCSLMNDLWSPLQNNRRQYLKPHYLIHDPSFLQHFSDLPLDDVYNPYEIVNDKDLSFHFLKSQTFRPSRNWAFKTLVHELHSLQATPLPVSIMELFSTISIPRCQQTGITLNEGKEITPLVKPVSHMKLSKLPSASNKEAPTVTVIVDAKYKENPQESANFVMSLYMDEMKLSVSPLTRREDKCAMMNQELVNRKCKKMNKTSKKRRRRQKKSNSVVWETSVNSADEPRTQLNNSKTKDGKNKQSHENNLCGNVDIVINVGDRQSPLSSVSLILGHGESDSPDDWDCDDEYDSDNFNISMTDITIEFPDLLTNNLSSLCLGSATPVFNNAACHINVIDIREISPKLLEVNRKWQKMMVGFNSSKEPTKVSFSQDNLITVFPVEMYDRKGEWEIYARERAYFKRRVERMEEILSPILTASHRQKVYQRLFKDSPLTL